MNTRGNSRSADGELVSFSISHVQLGYANPQEKMTRSCANALKTWHLPDQNMDTNGFMCCSCEKAGK